MVQVSCLGDSVMNKDMIEGVYGQLDTLHKPVVSPWCQDQTLCIASSHCGQGLTYWR